MKFNCTLARLNLAHSNMERHRSIVVESMLYSLFLNRNLRFIDDASSPVLSNREKKTD
jgi:hypothetical protein